MSTDVCELTVEIFSRLPSKSLLRFRSLSKSLRVCIDSPSFISLHALRSPKKFMIIHKICNKEEAETKRVYTIHSEHQLSYVGITPVEYPFRGICPMLSIVGSCNGIICLCEYGRDNLHLWNPSIRRKVTIHDLPSQCDCLGHGFGFDTVIDDYKILRICKTGTFVYTVKTHTWREIASPSMGRLCCVNPGQCLLNGALHWVVDGHLSYPDGVRSCRYILKFDLSSEVFSMIRLPEPGLVTGQVTIFKGSLAVIYEYTRIRMRNNDAASWSSSLTLNTQRLVKADIGFLYATRGDLMYSSYGKGIQIYNSETEVLLKLAGLNDSSYIVGMITCIESLGLLDMGTSCDQGKRIIGRKRS